MFEIIIILILISINGILAMSEIAFVSAKRYKLEERSKEGNQSAKKALLLLSEPERFLSAVQIGITLVGIFAGAFGGYAMAEDLTPAIAKVNLLAPYAEEISLGIIVTSITYLSLVIGELVPKSIALNNPEKITLAMAPLMYFISKAFSPIVWFLSVSTQILTFLAGIKKRDESPVSEDELKSLLELGTIHGTFEKEESEIIKRIFSFNDKKVAEIMIPRTEIEWINSNLSNDEIFQFISTHHYSRYFVCENNIDQLTGILESKDFLIRYNTDRSFDLKSILSDPLVIPETFYSIELLERFKSFKTNIALVVDEYGGTQGMVTLHDLIETVVGEIPEKYDDPEKNIFKRQDGTYLVDGSTHIERISDLLSVEFTGSGYSTMGGFLMTQLGRIPKEGDEIIYHGCKFEVIDMDRNRVDKIIITKLSNIH